MTILKLDTYDIQIDDYDISNVIRNGVVINTDVDGNPLLIFGGWDLVRSICRFYLAASDWTQLPDVPLSDNERALWQAYRQQVRDIPNVYTDYHDVIFPTPPQE